MSEVRLVVREENRDWSGTIHGSSADRAIAALSADPFTMDEFELATARFEKPSPTHRFFSNLRPGSNAEPYDAGVVVIDLVARVVYAESTYSSPGREGYVEYHCGHRCTEKSLRYHLADDWQFFRHYESWESVAEKRRKQLFEKPTLDARAVFYGKPLLVFVARQCFAEFARRDEIAAVVRVQWIENARERLAKESQISADEVDVGRLTDEEITPKTWSGEERHASQFYDTMKNIHAAWLLTPREELRGASPREIIFDRHKHLVWDLDDRCNQWSQLQSCPQGLEETSHAFKYAGFGTHELVMYYDLVRELLWSCWEKLEELARSPEVEHRPESMMVGDFLMAEVPRLERIRDEWLDVPHSDTRGRTPRSIIDRERARLPEVMSGRDAMVDPDCPCCQMMGESLGGPWFWHYDGCNNDDEFAFDTSHRTREEWDEAQRRSEEFNRRFNRQMKAERDERERLGVKSSTPGEDGFNAIWSSSFSVGDTADVPLGIRVFGIGCHLANLIVGLRGEFDRETTPAETQRKIDQVNRDFGNLRELLQTSDLSLAEALIEPVLNRFAETLTDIETARPELATQCEAVSEDLNTLLGPPPPEPKWDDDDLGFPF